MCQCWVPPRVVTLLEFPFLTDMVVLAPESESFSLAVSLSLSLPLSLATVGVLLVFLFLSSTGFLCAPPPFFLFTLGGFLLGGDFLPEKNTGIS